MADEEVEVDWDESVEVGQEWKGGEGNGAEGEMDLEAQDEDVLSLDGFEENEGRCYLHRLSRWES